LKIGNVVLEEGAALAPMAGVADRAFRQICRSFGAVYTVGEMVSSRGLVLGNRKSTQLLELGPLERPAAVQLFGDDPDAMARAVAAAMAAKPDVIDINMGCPAPKIAGSRSGSALMKEPELAARIIRAVKDASPVPVTVKFRKGWDDAHVNAVEFARMAEASGADAITVHGRTRAQMYAAPVDWDIIRQVKEAVKIPVIGNGDVDSPQAARALLDTTGCDLVMVGRGALGRPWLLGQIREYLTTGRLLPDPPMEERMAVMVEHIRLMASYKGDAVAFREARKHCGWYMTGMRGAAALRRQAGTIESLEDVRALARAALEQAAQAGEIR
jgi:tRNA-dihydrouridine synthase B